MLNKEDKIWALRDGSPHNEWLADRLGVPTIIAHLLANRNVSTVDSAKSFLSPRLASLRNPFLLKDMDRAVEVITDFIERRKKITIYGDYDADGITATSLLINLFSYLGASVNFYIPDRLKEGYGLNKEAIEKIAKTGTSLIVTVDCGINSKPEIELAKEMGVEVVVTDHHKIPSDFNPLCPTINPARPDSLFPFRELAGVGIAFYLAIAVRSRFREKGLFKDIDEPDLRPYLGLVALGTVADVVPLFEENRILVKSGLAALKDSRQPGIRMLLRAVNREDGQSITTDDIAFRIAPRLNAAGRLGSAMIAVRMLTTKSEKEASLISDHLDNLNNLRQGIQDKIIAESRERIDKIEDFESRRTIVVSDYKWHKGVIGIVASKIAEEYYRPTFIFCGEGDMLTGSGRSIEGFDLYNALSELSDLLEQYGGHNYAAGVTMENNRLGEFCERFEDIARNKIDSSDMKPKIEVDAKIGLRSIRPALVREIEMLLPFGHDNPEPIFWAGPLNVMSSKIVGKNHLKLRVKAEGVSFDCIAFGKADHHSLEGKSVDLLFHIGINKWQGFESIQLDIVDLRLN